MADLENRQRMTTRSSRSHLRIADDLRSENSICSSRRSGPRPATGNFRQSSSNLVASSSGIESSTVTQQAALAAIEEANLRKELRYFFMTPCEKWKYRKKLPVKLAIQLVKVFLVTTLVLIFGHDRAVYVSYMSTLHSSFQHLYLLNWNPTYETPPYPPSAGAYAVYTCDDFYQTVDYALSQYNATQALETDTFQVFHHPNSSEVMPARFCVTQYKDTFVASYNRTLRVDFDLFTWCTDIRPVSVYNQTSNQTDLVYSVREFLKQEKNISGLQFEAIDYVRLHLAFVSVRPPSVSFAAGMTDCYLLNVTITFDNSAKCGQIPIRLNVHPNNVDCSQPISNPRRPNTTSYVISGLVIGFCIASFVLSTRSLRRGYLLMRATDKHFNEVLAQPLTLGDRFEFANLWYVMVFCSDVLAICGSVMKLLIDDHVSHAYDACSLMLGITVLLVWFGVMRYLTFFPGYSDLLLTLKKAAPSMARYLSVAITMYLGFILCGWIVIGPYHFKMSTLSSTAECMYALMNGDDMYATFANLSLDVASDYVNVFLRVYLYSFVAIFIYMVLSVFLSVILDVYETVKQKGTTSLHQAQAASSDLFKFIYRLDDDDSIAVKQLSRDSARSRSRVMAADRRIGSVNIHASTSGEQRNALQGIGATAQGLLSCCSCVQSDEAD